MRFYDAETMRRIAHLAPDRDQTVSELRAALDLARSQGARPFELRIALDLHELLGGDADPLLEQAMRPVLGRRMDRGPRGRTDPRHDAAVTATAPSRRHPRRRHGRRGRGLAAERTGMAGRLRVDHGLPTWLEARRQGRKQQRAERPDRGARPARVDRLLRERVPAPARVLRRARPAHDGPRRADQDMEGRDLPLPDASARGPPPGRLASLGRRFLGERPAPGRAGSRRARLRHRGHPAARAAARHRLPRDPQRDGGCAAIARSCS